MLIFYKGIETQSRRVIHGLLRRKSLPHRGRERGTLLFRSS